MWIITQKHVMINSDLIEVIRANKASKQSGNNVFYVRAYDHEYNYIETLAETTTEEDAFEIMRRIAVEISKSKDSYFQIPSNLETYVS